MSDQLTTVPDRLHALVDGQLDAADRAQLLTAMEEDPQLRRQVSDLRQLKEMVGLAFEHPPARPVHSRSCRRRFGPAARLAAAALGLFLLGFLAGRIF